MKIAVIGAGIVGASFAYHLARAGADVTLVDANRPGNGTSGASAAHLNYFRKTPESYLQLHLAAFEVWRELLLEIDGQSALHLDGGLFWADSEAEWRVLEQKMRYANAQGERAERLPCRDIAPWLTPPLEGDPYWVEKHGWIEVIPVLQGLIAAAERRGLKTRFHDPVTALAPLSGGRLWRLTTAGGPLDVDRVVLATGPDSAQTAALIGVNLPVTRRPGLIAITAPVVSPIKHVVTAPGFSFRPDGGGRVLLGLGQHHTPESGRWSAEEKVRAQERLAQQLTQWLPAAGDAAIETLRIGIRPVPVDGLPIVGSVDRAPGIYLAAMHSGVCLGPLLGKAGAAEILHNTPQPELAPYRIDRLAS